MFSTSSVSVHSIPVESLTVSRDNKNVSTHYQMSSGRLSHPGWEPLSRVSGAERRGRDLPGERPGGQRRRGQCGWGEAGPGDTSVRPCRSPGGLGLLLWVTGASAAVDPHRGAREPAESGSGSLTLQLERRGIAPLLPRAPLRMWAWVAGPSWGERRWSLDRLQGRGRSCL